MFYLSQKQVANQKENAVIAKEMLKNLQGVVPTLKNLSVELNQ
jgi:hypothetical protein